MRKTVLLLVLLTVATFGATGGASALSQEGKIEFHSTRGGDSTWGAYRMDPDGGNVEPSAYYPTSSDWSADGSVVVFRCQSDDGWDICVRDLKAGSTVNITAVRSFEYTQIYVVTISTDGSRVTFVARLKGEFGVDIFTVSATGGEQTLISDEYFSASNPDWGPNNKIVCSVMTSPEPGWAVMTMNPDGSGDEGLASGSSPRWSPDGTKIVFEGNINTESSSGTREGAGVYTMNADGSGVVLLAKNGGSPSWSPDGASIAYQYADDEPWDTEIYVMDSDGGNKTNITNNHAAEDASPNWHAVVPNPDTTAPTGSVLIDGGRATTSDRTVTLRLRATDPVVEGHVTSGVEEMRIKNARHAWSAWMPHETTKSWLLSVGQGTKRVYVQYKDAAGNVSARASDSITYRR